MLHSLQSEIQLSTQLVEEFTQVAQDELSQARQEPFFKNSPDSQVKHFLLIPQVRQSELQFKIQLVGLFSQVAHWVLSQDKHELELKYSPA